VSYVCAVKRKFRVPGQTFADSIGALIAFIEANPMVRASELAPKFLKISVVPPVKPPEPVAAGAEASGAAAAVPAGAEPPRPEANLSIDERAKISRLQGDLMWLVREGYVTEFIDGRLFAPPPMVEARKKEIESEEHDPENFPEAPPSAEAPTPAHGSPTVTEAAPPSETEESASQESAPVEDSAEANAAPSETAAPDEARQESPVESDLSSSTEQAPEEKKAEPPAPTIGT
jgi:hypothetical protein